MYLKNEILPFAATWLDLENIIVSEEVREREMLPLICGILKNNTNESIYKTEKQAHRHRKQIYGYQRRKEREG